MGGRRKKGRGGGGGDDEGAKVSFTFLAVLSPLGFSGFNLTTSRHQRDGSLRKDLRAKSTEKFEAV